MHIGLDFYTGCIAFSAVGVHICLTGPHRWTLRVLPCCPKPFLSFSLCLEPRLGLSSEKRSLALSVCFQKGHAGGHRSHSRWEVGEQGGSGRCPTLTLSIFSLGRNPSEPLSSSTLWAGHQCRSCRPPCGHPLLEDGPYSPESSGAELLPAPRLTSPGHQSQ